jgi:hypothetical protein
MITQVENLTIELCNHLRSNFLKQGFGENFAPTFSFQTGKKYLKIVARREGEQYGSVHAFVDKKTGDLYKAASWAAPAKGVRYNLFNDIEKLKVTADWAGSYLYR